jgi:hypothetical protein
MNRLHRFTGMVPAVILLGMAGCPTEGVTGAFQIVNAAPGVLITELYLVPSGSASEGRNRLLQPLGLGQSATIGLLAPGYYDERAVAVVLDDSSFVQLPNPQIAIQAGRTYVHTVYWTSEDPLISGPSLDDFIGRP